MKKAAKMAVAIATGVTIGGCLLPRITGSHLYNNSWPPIWQQAILYFAVAFGVAFVIFLVTNKHK